MEYIRAQRARTLLMRQMAETMSQWDALVSPTGSESLVVTNLTGHPQIVLPCGFLPQAPQGQMPVGILFTGRLYEEGTILRIAHSYERAAGWFKMHPKLDAS